MKLPADANCSDENICGEVNPTEAYLTGLFHKIGSLPVMLDWDSSRGLSGDPVHGGLRLADAWFLPQCIAEYFSELQDGNLRPIDSNRSAGP